MTSRSLVLLAALLALPSGAALAQGEVDALAAETLADARRTLSPSEAALVERAITFAREAHRGQVRDGGRPAVLHALRVARGVMNGGHLSGAGRGEVVAAAVLHDVVEDTRFTLEQVRARFGERVARHVHDVTLDPVERHGGDKEARDRAYYERFSRAARGSHVIKLVDRTDNVRDMQSWQLEGKLGYLQSTRDKVIRALRARSPDLARILEAEVARQAERYRAEQAAQTGRLAGFRRGDGTLRWKALLAERARVEGAGLLHFSLALFLKELAVVVRTGDAGRIEEFFDGLLSTDFFVHYGLFAAGARVGEVAFSRYLERHVRPGFVRGLLKTQVTLAAGLALPDLVRGTFQGEAFAISLTSLGLSTAAVRAGLKGIEWVARLPRGGAAGLGLKLGRLTSVAGFVYSVAETAVILYLADDLQERMQGYLDARRAREAVGEATGELLAAAGADDPARLEQALSAFEGAWDGYREFLYRPLLVEEARLAERLAKHARDAKLLADEREAVLARVADRPALRARLEARHGSLEGYAEARAAQDAAALEASLGETLTRYEAASDQARQAIYGAERRGGGYLAELSPAERDWLAAGTRDRAAGDPYGGRGDPLARLGRAVSRRSLEGALQDVSGNRLQSFEDQLAALTLAGEALAEQPAARAAVAQAVERVRRAAALDQGLAGGRGLVGALEDAR